jgi:hypothetical protein
LSPGITIGEFTNYVGISIGETEELLINFIESLQKILVILILDKTKVQGTKSGKK